jgi:hypothetical protein
MHVRERAASEDMICYVDPLARADENTWSWSVLDMARRSSVVVRADRCHPRWAAS